MIKLTSTNTVRENSVIQTNLDDKYINVAIEEVQIQYIEPLFNSLDDYNDLLLAVSTNTLTSEQRSLIIDYIEPYMFNRIKRKLKSEMNSLLTNKGPQQQSGDNSTYVSTKLVFDSYAEIDRTGEFLKSRLINKLNDMYSYDSCKPKSTVFLGISVGKRNYHK